MPTFDEAPILSLGTQPIPGAAPAGSDAGDDPHYIAVQAEMTKLGRIEFDPPDWFVVFQSSTTFLREKSKDLEITAALGHALFKQNGYHGLAVALQLFIDLVNNFWDGLFPERPRRRKARIESLVDVFTEAGWFKEHPPKSDDFDPIDVCVTRIGELAALLTAKMPDEPPEFGKFTRAIKELAGKRPKPASPAAAPAAPSASGEAGGALPAVAEPGDINAAENELQKLCTFIRKNAPASPLPFAITRLVKWAEIRLPIAEEAKYQIPPPDAQIVDAMQHQAANGLFEHLLNSAEAAFRSEDPLWLDVQRYTCVALAGLGPMYENARQAVMSVTGGLVRRLGAGVFELRFRNGNPLCSGDTKMWIEAELSSGGGGGGKGGGHSNGKLTEASDTARKLAGSGKLKEAVGA
ncbi:MAG TPA: TssA family type VI secretion system protein, partial [Phycisphaerae bacterium]|nr:TssA family type VI secretion system protein [Phycisphaerae bacterium]